MNNSIPFDCDSYPVEGFNLSYLDSGENKPPLHFYHANGFPVSVYLPMMIKLTDDFRVLGIGLRGQDAQAEGNTSWYRVADDLIDFLEKKHLTQVLGVGHSIGGVATMIAAVKRPDLFSQIILIDPAIIPYRYIAAMAFIKAIGKKQLFFLAKRARGRRNFWQDRNEAFNFFNKKTLFRSFHKDFLKSYVTYGLKESESGGVELLCPPEAEARIFENYPLGVWSWPARLKVPTHIIHGENSDVLFKSSVREFCRKCPKATPYTVKGAGHLIPMEKPDEIISLIEKIGRR